MEEVGMKKILGLVALLLVVSPALAVDNATIAYTLEIGGNNHAAQVKAGTAVAYTAGNPADGQAVSGGTLNWAVRATVTGEHGGFPAYGAANLVWDLELRDAANNLVAVGKGAPGTAGFYSSINDGTAGNPLQAAAFAFGYADGPGDPAHIYDAVSANGPHLAQKTYPSTNAFPAGAPSDGSLSGKLVGMGAGYQDFKASSGTERPGVGVEGTFDVGCTGLASGPVAEGQIDLTGLGGAYTLKVVAGNGNNVLRGDMEYSCNGDASGNFAVKADVVTGDTITFTVPVTCQAPVVASVASRRTHGGVDFDLPIATAGAATIEPRQNGPQTLVLTFDQDLDVAVAPTSSLGTAAVNPANHKEVLVTGMGAITDGSCVSITVTGAKAGNGNCLSAAKTIKITALFGDVNQSGGVDAGDIGQVKLQSLKPITASNYLKDVNVSGGIDAGDIGQVKLRSLKVVPATCTN